MIQIGQVFLLLARFFHLPVLILLLAALPGITGCASLLQPQPAPQTYVLDVGIDSPASPRKSDLILLVARPRAEPGFDSPYIAYTDTPLALDYYTQSKWADTPARMLLPLVVRAMDTTGAFNAVLAPPTSVPGDLRLDIDIIRLQQEFFYQPSQVRLTLRAQLINIQTNEILGSQYFEAVEPATGENAYGGAQAANRAVKQILEGLVEFVMLHTHDTIRND